MSGRTTSPGKPASPSRAPAGERVALGAMLGTVVVVLFTLYLLAVWFDWLPRLRGWENYPLGWTWLTYPLPPAERFIPVLVSILGIWLVISLTEMSQGARQAAGTTGRRTVKALYLIGMVALGVVLQMSLLGLKSANVSALLLERVTSRSFTGYFNQAASAQDASLFFGRYTSTFEARNCLHCHSHPPGPSLFYWLTIRAVDSLPGDWQDAMVDRTFDLLGDDPALDAVRTGFTGSQVVAAYSGGLLVLTIAAMVVIPLFGLARLLGPPGYEFRLAGLGLALPGLMLMVPEFDQVLATVAAVALYVGLRGILATDALSGAVLGVACGFVIAVGMFFSWSLTSQLLLVAAIGFCVFLGGKRIIVNWVVASPRVPVGVWLPWLVGLVGGVAVPLLLVWLTTGTDLLYIFTYNVDAQVRAEAQRPFSVWVYQGPLDFLQFLGLPLAVMTLVALFVPTWQNQIAYITLDETAPEGMRKAMELPWYAHVNIYAIFFWLALLAIDLSGRTKAEQGRLLLFMMPLALAAVYFWAGRTRAAGWFLTLLFFMQMAVMVIIGARWFVP